MSGLVRALVALPCFLAFASLIVLATGIADVVAPTLLLVGAGIVGYLVASGWALLIDLPFVAYGLAMVDERGPLETAHGDWGLVVLAAMALPVALGAILGLIWRRASGSPTLGL